jgi:hypothetical protein
LETPLLIRGLQVRYYYLMGGVIAVFSLYLLASFLSLTKTMTLSGLTEFVMKLIFSIVACGLIYIYLAKRSRVTKYSFKNNKKTTISNRDIFKYL